MVRRATNPTTTAGKRKISIVLEPEQAQRLQDLADTRKVSLNSLLVELVTRGEEAINAGAIQSFEDRLLNLTHQVGEDLRKDLGREVTRQYSSLRGLLARIALESIADRGLLLRLYAESAGADAAKDANNAAWTRAVESLKEPTGAVKKALDSLKEE